MIKAINSNCFVRLDDKEEEVGGIDISEKAQVNSQFGSIVSIDKDCPFAKEGDRVQVPYFSTHEVEVDGEMLVTFNMSRLFYVNGSPVGGYVLVRKCENEHIKDEDGEIALYMTDHHISFSNWVEILECAEDCVYMKPEYAGLYTVAPENDDKLARIGRTDTFAMHESLVQFLTKG